MFQSAHWLFFYAGMLLSTAADARVPSGQDHDALEARWQTWAATATDTRPALEFPYADCFSKAAATYDIPETLLLAVARGESDFKPEARSSANAYGLMQILWPATARHLGINSLSQLTDPCTNVDAGARYLQELSTRYHGNLHRMLAAYNYGPGRIPVKGGHLPKGAVWYSGYIARHLDYVIGKQGTGGTKRQPYADQGRLFVIRFARPYRAEAFVKSLQPRLGDLRLDWFRKPDGQFDVVLITSNPKEMKQGKQRLAQLGF